MRMNNNKKNQRLSAGDGNQQQKDLVQYLAEEKA
jgi:hypothetical protein